MRVASWIAGLVISSALAAPVGPIPYSALPSCADSAGNHLNASSSTGAISCGTSVPANVLTSSSTITGAKTVVWDSTTAVTAQTVEFPVEWTSYTITKVFSAVSGGGSFTADIKIGSTDVTSCSAISVSGTTNASTTCTGANTGSAADQINVVISSPSGTVDQAYVSVIFTHTPN